MRGVPESKEYKREMSIRDPPSPPLLLKKKKKKHPHPPKKKAKMRREREARTGRMRIERREHTEKRVSVLEAADTR